MVLGSDSIPNDTYSDSYIEFIKFFSHIQAIDYHSLVISSYFTYGWMPTILKNFNHSNNIDKVLMILNKVKNNEEIFEKDYCELVTCINNSVIGVSKILHFINPDNYPIFDSRVKNYFKKNKLFRPISEYCKNKEKEIRQYITYKNLCSNIIENEKYKNTIEKIIKQKLNSQLEISSLRILENTFFLLDKN